MGQLREKGIRSVGEVKECYLEGDGRISMIPRNAKGKKVRTSTLERPNCRPQPHQRAGTWNRKMHYLRRFHVPTCQAWL